MLEDKRAYYVYISGNTGGGDGLGEYAGSSGIRAGQKSHEVSVSARYTIYDVVDGTEAVIRARRRFADDMGVFEEDVVWGFTSVEVIR